jgi:hypothetical protein
MEILWGTTEKTLMPQRKMLFNSERMNTKGPVESAIGNKATCGDKSYDRRNCFAMKVRNWNYLLYKIEAAL